MLEDDEEERAVIRVLMTQMGFVMRTVAEPAMAPQSIDSTVVSLWAEEEVEVRRAAAAAAARVKKVRVHSYPFFSIGLAVGLGLYRRNKGDRWVVQ